MSLARKLKKWSDHQLISDGQARAILDFEKNTGRSRLYLGLGGLGVISILFGIASLVAANWDIFSPSQKLVSHATINIVLAGVFLRYFQKQSWIREILISVLAGLVMTFIALIGQTLHTQAPIWQPLLLWLALTTPMLMIYARFFGIVWVWIGILATATTSFSFNVLPAEHWAVVLTTMPYLLVTIFNINGVRSALKNWSEATSRAFSILLVVATSVSQLQWRGVNLLNTGIVDVIITSGVGTLILFLLNSAARNKLVTFWSPVEKEKDALLVGSFFFMALPAIIPHGHVPAIGATMFCLYWLYLGALSLRLGYDGIWSLAVVVVGLRIFAAYIEIMGSLAIQGVGFITTGLIFLALAWVTRKIMKLRPTWLIPQPQGGA